MLRSAMAPTIPHMVGLDFQCSCLGRKCATKRHSAAGSAHSSVNSFAAYPAPSSPRSGRGKGSFRAPRWVRKLRIPWDFFGSGGALKELAPGRRDRVENEEPVFVQRREELDREERIAVGFLLHQLRQRPRVFRRAMPRTVSAIR